MSVNRSVHVQTKTRTIPSVALISDSNLFCRICGTFFWHTKTDGKTGPQILHAERTAQGFNPSVGMVKFHVLSRLFLKPPTKYVGRGTSFNEPLTSRWEFDNKQWGFAFLPYD